MNANVGGVVPLSTVDWHGKSAVVVFLNGCSFRCGYCHNYDLLTKSNPTDLDLVKKRIMESKPFISSVVFLGGEPLMQGDAVEEIAVFSKENGLLVGIHTNGYYPETVSLLIEKNLADKFFVDIKAPFEKEIYNKTVGVQAENIIERIQETIQIIDKSPAELEIKTTVFPEIVGTKEQIADISKWMNENIRQKTKLTYVLQQGKGGNSNDPVFQKMTFLSPEEMNELAKTALEYLKNTPVITQTDEDGRVVKN
ncbi:anaerobic ribonucleoside-triphosphate reductase activating protein [Methanimicrococcus blatticola]|uniref:Pyruvate formate lyase activating enzyme n=1 Tax=Methanimicrococcus blatticola TaxID=91560 RepID=A0A484F3K5_9EURY|nr:anaerobic ribonucleoside-triphosphate reductase activating protein [Methanimicrococcus blatticola]MBZ3935685.1 anaerobic ribonucleoside-triphosphate reductase activating protein [Methanimicrococcus blatticola]MCC2508194.1 anaerobic ribonucleoside-triphosphate reductase activating protein [Methanimicrococcus blatticola]TDQ68728.1 pyruvate formate lyase activating enzyme [Methanimicrococcus blatticola]